MRYGVLYFTLWGTESYILLCEVWSPIFYFVRYGVLYFRRKVFERLQSVIFHKNLDLNVHWTSDPFMLIPNSWIQVQCSDFGNFHCKEFPHFGVLLWGLLFGRINQGKSYCLLMEVFIFYEALQFIINRNLDIILFSGTKLDHSFPSAQFWYSLWAYGLDRNSNGGGLLLYVREDTPSKFPKVKSDCNIKSIYVEVNLRKRKWFNNGPYNPSKSFL